ncbi:MAG TPA: von Willebrand factor type A domain-containing protein, partial [Myxococcus sp.]|nr:von Willebrand factor type A domain-containing protein [Myxococcus sp.]
PVEPLAAECLPLISPGQQGCDSKVDLDFLRKAEVARAAAAEARSRPFAPLAPLAPPMQSGADGIAQVRTPGVLRPSDDRDRAPAWTLQHLPVLLPDGSSQSVYRPPEHRPLADSDPRGFGVNPTIDTEEERFSTFPVAVDPSSYALARGYLERDTLPPEASVRVESFVNSVDYGEVGEVLGPFLVHVEGFPSPSRKGYHVVRVSMKAREAFTDVGVQVEFDRQAVARYRLVGYENLTPEQEPPATISDTEEDDLYPLRPGETVTAIYEVKLIGPAIAFGTLRIVYEQGEGTMWRRVQKLMASSLLRSSYAKAAPATRLSYVAAAFAEKLRGSPWTRTLEWSRLHGLFEDVGEPLRGRPDVAKLGALIRKAQGLDTRKPAPVSSLDSEDGPGAGD